MGDEGLSWDQRLHSHFNRFFWRLRDRVAFTRRGYKEIGTEDVLSPLELRLLRESSLKDMAAHLSPFVLRKNLFTLWTLEQFKHVAPNFSTTDWGLILEPGCQDFARLPALRSFWGPNVDFVGWEIDAHRVMTDLHSRADRARYYQSIVQGRSRYVPGNFFSNTQTADVIVCFYPFVSVSPALAWGLPADVGDPHPWLHSFSRSLKNEGYLLLVHQGEWEEEIFNDARRAFPMFKKIHGQTLECPFYQPRHPAFASLYLKTS